MSHRRLPQPTDDDPAAKAVTRLREDGDAPAFREHLEKLGGTVHQYTPEEVQAVSNGRNIRRRVVVFIDEEHDRNLRALARAFDISSPMELAETLLSAAIDVEVLRRYAVGVQLGLSAAMSAISSPGREGHVLPSTSASPAGTQPVVEADSPHGPAKGSP